MNGLWMEIFKYEYMYVMYNLSRKNILKIIKFKPISLPVPLLFKDFVIFVRDSQISTQIDLPANFYSLNASNSLRGGGLYPNIII